MNATDPRVTEPTLHKSMRSSLEATAILGGGSLVGLAVGLVFAKVSAVLLGPSGVGYLGLLQSTLSLATLLANAGIYGLMRAVARARMKEDLREEAALRRSAWRLSWAIGGGVVILIVLLREPLSRLALGRAGHAGAIVVIAAAVLLAVATAVQSSILNAYHRVRELARFGVFNSVFSALILLPLIVIWRDRGLAWGVFAANLASLAVMTAYARRLTPAPPVRVTASEERASARELLSFGIPLTASAVVGTGVQLSVPVLVLHVLGTEHVGFYRAAAGVSAIYLGFLISAMGQDYYPRVSAAGDEPIVLVRLINEQFRIVLLIAGPLILGMLALVRYLIPIVYTPQFAPTAALLEWQLIGDVFRITAFTMSFVILAQRGSLPFFLTELAGGSALLIFSWLGMRRFGLEGLGAAFILSALISYVLCWIILRRGIALRLTPKNRLLFAALILSVFVIRVLPYIGLERARTPVALILAVAVTLHSLYVIWGETGGLRRMPVSERGAP